MKRRDLDVSDTLGDTGRNKSKSGSVSSGHDGGTRPSQTSKKSKDLSVREGEERGRGRGGVCMMCGRVSEWEWRVFGSVRPVVLFCLL